MVARFNPSGSMKKAKKSVNKLGMKMKKPSKGRKIKAKEDGQVVKKVDNKSKKEVEKTKKVDKN